MNVQGGATGCDQVVLERVSDWLGRWCWSGLQTGSAGGVGAGFRLAWQVVLIAGFRLAQQVVLERASDWLDRWC
jgi:hypothetical protein